MAKPITRTFQGNKDQVMELFLEVLARTGMQRTGCNTKRGVISFHKSPDEVLYAHIAERENDSVSVSIAPGLSLLKQRDQTEVPAKVINRLMDKLNTTIKNEN